MEIKTNKVTLVHKQGNIWEAKVVNPKYDVEADCLGLYLCFHIEIPEFISNHLRKNHNGTI